ncbi:hypothetical protein UPYG_G00146880 [Umbra pygmaea]|uniref:Ig-like domain-containing protein n=1 Tax=Umbra pygmaea TaxID=75934 RepID=A0ABD0XEQ4_UMBPY
MWQQTMLLLLSVIFGLWRDTHAVSPVPSVPDRVPALAGSCVVIPCSFTPPASSPFWSRQNEIVDVRLRYRKGHIFSLWTTAFSTADRSASLLDNTASGDCSVVIDRVTLADSMEYELSLKGNGERDWGKGRRINLVVSDSTELPVISGMGRVTEGQVVSLNCSLNYSCPFHPPALLWHWERGPQENCTEHQGPQELKPQGRLWASITFTAVHHIKSRVRCEAVYPGGRRIYTIKELHVTFPPKDVMVSVHTVNVQEGRNALLDCSCKADPPVSDYRWSYTQQGTTVKLPQRSNRVRVYNVTRDMTVRCTAQNLVGWGESKPTSLNIQYKPVILHVSSCIIEDLKVVCRCSVDSNPRPNITWSVNDSIPPLDYNISVRSENGTQTAELTGHMETPLRVVCYAINALGNDSQTLLHTEDGYLQWKVVPAACIALVAFILSVLLLACCRRRTGKHALKCRPSVYPVDMVIYQDRMPLYINCTEVTHIYTNGSYQLVYQNCTPCFVKTKQARPIGRRGGERRGGERRCERRGEERLIGERRGVMVDRATRDRPSPASNDTSSETAIYLEII